MSSPDIDLDMDLLSSPIPPARAGGYGGGGGDERFGVDGSGGDGERGGAFGRAAAGGAPSAFEHNGNGRVVVASNDPPFRPGHGAGGGDGSRRSVAGAGAAANGGSRDLPAKNDDGSGDAEGGPGRMIAEGGPPLLMVVDGKPTQHYRDAVGLVESWREELHIMSVKNAILLDDLVKLGADV